MARTDKGGSSGRSGKRGGPPPFRGDVGKDGSYDGHVWHFGERKYVPVAGRSHKDLDRDLKDAGLHDHRRERYMEVVKAGRGKK